MATRVLVVDDEELGIRTLTAILSRAGHDVRHERTVADALAASAEWAPHAAILDRWLPDGDGVDLARALRKQSPSLRRLVLLTGDRPPRRLTPAVDAWLRKPVSTADLLSAIEGTS